MDADVGWRRHPPLLQRTIYSIKVRSSGMLIVNGARNSTWFNNNVPLEVPAGTRTTIVLVPDEPTATLPRFQVTLRLVELKVPLFVADTKDTPAGSVSTNLAEPAAAGPRFWYAGVSR